MPAANKPNERKYFENEPKIGSSPFAKSTAFSIWINEVAEALIITLREIIPPNTRAITMSFIASGNCATWVHFFLTNSV